MSDKASVTCIARDLPPVPRGRLDACLVHIYPVGPDMGRRFPLGGGPVVVGRSESCDLSVPDASVSRRHARIAPGPDGFAVADLDSTNGTFVNDKPVTAPTPLADGDYLRVGNCLYRFLAGGNVEAEYHEEIYRLTISDGLTRLHNQRYLFDFLERELARSGRHRRPLAVLLMDVDHFKQVNDDHGHLCGDLVLRQLADRLRPEVRREDLFARYGGEEFAFVLVETTAAEAAALAERVRAAVAAAPFFVDGHMLAVSVSIGVGVTDGSRPLSPPDLIRLADEKLYSAKRAGRNRVVG